jgi:hypothetical protein
MGLAVLEVVKFTFLIVFLGLLSLVIYVLWLVKKKMSEESIFFEIFTWLLYCNVSVEAYALMYCILAIFAFDPSTNAILSVILYIPLAFFVFFIYMVAKDIWESIEKYGLK